VPSEPTAAQIRMRDYKEREALAMIDVVIAASDQHDEECGCEGEACKLGDMLARLDAVRETRPHGR
jgi:hypothetical protein